MEAIERLTLEQKVGQLMMFGYLTAEIPDHMKTWIKEKHIGNVILFGRNITSLEETYARVSQLQAWAKEVNQPYPLLVATDQENGVVTRLKEGSTSFPGAMTLGATRNPALAAKIYEATGKELLAAGINMNLAPIVDVNNNPYNPVIGVRSFGEDVNDVTELGIEAVRGLEKSRVVSVLKHFPGHGDTDSDSHLTLPTIGHDKERLHRIELFPFKKAIDAGAPVVMMAHVNFPAFDDRGLPATVSSKIVSGLLRDELGFDGVIMSDCMEMDAVSKTLGSGEAAVMAINAGIDLILVSHMESFQIEVYERVLLAARNGEISEDRLNEALTRIYSLKQTYVNWEGSLTDEAPHFNKEMHEQLSLKTIAEAVTLVRDETHVIPLKDTRPLGIVMPAITGLTLAEDEHGRQQGLTPALKRYMTQIKTNIVSTDVTDEEIRRVVDEFESIEQVIVCTYNAQTNKGQQRLVQSLLNEGKELIVVALRNPYDLMLFPDVKTFIAAYEFKEGAMEVVSDILFGKRTAKGHLPVHIPGLYGLWHGLTGAQA